MPASYTPNLNLALPEPNVDANWGVTLNADFTLIDNLFASNGSGTSIGVNVGSGKTLLLGGTMLLGTGDGTGSVTAPTIRGAARTGTNAVGANLTIDAANGTGTGGSGSIILRTAPPAAAGTTANTMQNSVVIDSSGNVGITGTPTTKLNAIGASETTAAPTDAGTKASTILAMGGSEGTGSGGVFAVGAFGKTFAALKGVISDASGNGVGDLTISTRAATGDSSLTERIRVSKLGAIGLSGANYGTAGQVLSSNGSGAAPTWKNPGINVISAQTFTATGNSFTGIPADVTTITMNFTGLDPLSTADVLVQIGTSSGFVTTGYSSAGSSLASTSVSTTSSTTGFIINLTGAVGSGSIRLTKVTGNTWVSEHVVGTTSTRVCTGGGFLALPGTLDRVQIVPSTGTFTASGSVNLMYL